jgi:hypothetical protein
MIEETIYDIAVRLEWLIDNHASDLYIKATPEVFDELRKGDFNYTTFTCQRDRTLWVDVPFGFDPFWKRLG